MPARPGHPLARFVTEQGEPHESGQVWKVFSDGPRWQPLPSHLLRPDGHDAECLQPRLAVLTPDHEPQVIYRC